MSIFHLHSYFQITKVAQSVDKSWSTSLTTQMRIAPFKREVPKKEIRVGKSYLRNVLKLTEIEEN